MKSVVSKCCEVLRHCYSSLKVASVVIYTLVAIFSLLMVSLMVASLTISLSSCSSGTYPSGPLPGDLDGNGIVERIDLDLLVAYVTEFEEPPVPEVADVNKDGYVNVADIVCLANQLGGV